MSFPFLKEFVDRKKMFGGRRDGTSRIQFRLFEFFLCFVADHPTKSLQSVRINDYSLFPTQATHLK